MRIYSLEHHGTIIELTRDLGDRINKRIIWDHELPSEPIIDWCNHSIIGASNWEKATDTDPEMVLKNMESQTGLTFKKEKRKVPVLVIYPSELK